MAYLLNIPDDLRQELKILAARDGTTIREIIIEQLRDYLKKHKDGNPQHLLTNFLENGDFMGFPSMAIDLDKKKKWLKSAPKDLISELNYNIQEWQGEIKRL